MGGGDNKTKTIRINWIIEQESRHRTSEQNVKKKQYECALQGGDFAIQKHKTYPKACKLIIF